MENVTIYLTMPFMVSNLPLSKKKKEKLNNL